MSAATATTALATAASIAATAVLIRTVATDLVPSRLQDYLSNTMSSLLLRLSSDLTIAIDEFDGPVPNNMYKAAAAYLPTKLSPSTRRIRVSNPDDDGGAAPAAADTAALTVSIDRNQDIVDTFEGRRFRWRLIHSESLPRRRNGKGQYMEPAAFESRHFELTIHKRDRDIALRSYLPHVLSQAKLIKEEAKSRKLYTNGDGYWNCVPLRHPATFDTMAMDDHLKKALVDDLARFVRRREYYKRVGKAWKRGYLLYGPPGTGKSSLVAAMANYLRFDVYDLELTEVKSNADLRSLLVGTANRSILVVEDVDCAAVEALASREHKERPSEVDDERVTLSGLLNFVDGLWSSCGDERIVVFTTNHRERLDPALLRPGRMDMHVHMGYCTAGGFRVLARNYQCVDDHETFEEIGMLIGEVEITPAEVAEELMKSDDPDAALCGLVQALREKKGKKIHGEQHSVSLHNRSQT